MFQVHARAQPVVVKRGFSDQLLVQALRRLSVAALLGDAATPEQRAQPENTIGELLHVTREQSIGLREIGVRAALQQAERGNDIGRIQEIVGTPERAQSLEVRERLIGVRLCAEQVLGGNLVQRVIRHAAVRKTLEQPVHVREEEIGLSRRDTVLHHAAQVQSLLGSRSLAGRQFEHRTQRCDDILLLVRRLPVVIAPLVPRLGADFRQRVLVLPQQPQLFDGCALALFDLHAADLPRLIDPDVPAPGFFVEQRFQELVSRVGLW
jgi:hypothetical protein